MTRDAELCATLAALAAAMRTRTGVPRAPAGTGARAGIAASGARAVRAGTERRTGPAAMGVRFAVALAVVAVLAGCSSDQPARPLPGAGSGPTSAGAPATSAGSPTNAATPGSTRLASGAVQLTVRPEDVGQRPVLDSYLGFFAAYADALSKADPRSAQLRRHSTPDAFTDFSRSLAANARDGITLRGPVTLQPALRASGSGALTVILVDCLDGTAQRFYDRSGKPTGQAGARRPIQVELVNSPGPVRWIVGSVADGPATACERSGS